VIDTIDRLPQTGNKGIYLKQQLQDKLIEHKQYINKYGEDLSEIHDWKWKSIRLPAAHMIVHIYPSDSETSEPLSGLTDERNKHSTHRRW